MVTFHIHGKLFHFESLPAAEREAIIHLFTLHNRVMQARIHAQKLTGLLCASPYRNREESQAAQLRQEIRIWHEIRRAATNTRRMHGVPFPFVEHPHKVETADDPWPVSRLWHRIRHGANPDPGSLAFIFQ